MDKESLKQFIDGIDDDTQIIVINTKNDFEQLVRPQLPRSFIYRLGTRIAVCLKNMAKIATIWILAHDLFPSYIPNAEMFVATSYQHVKPILHSITADHNGLIPHAPGAFDYKFVDLGTGIAPLSAIPAPFNTGAYIRPSGQHYI
jgi:hypothetical protein